MSLVQYYSIFQMAMVVLDNTVFVLYFLLTCIFPSIIRLLLFLQTNMLTVQVSDVSIFHLDSLLLGLLFEQSISRFLIAFLTTLF